MKLQIQERIGQLRIELASLEVSHDRLVRDFNQHQQEFQQKVTANQSRFSQITGAIAELTELLQIQENEHKTGVKLNG